MYEKTKDLDKIMTNKEMDKAIMEDFENIKPFIDWWYGVITSTYIEYKAGSTEAFVWNEGEKKKTKIYLPLENGWYLQEDKYGIPNGAKAKSSNPNARYLWRWQDADYEGLLVRWYGDFGDGVRRYVVAGDRPYGRFGVAKTEKSKESLPEEIIINGITYQRK